MADRRHLGVFDATMLVMGGIVGSGIFVNPSVVANLVHTPGAILGVWALGGVIALAGAFVYAELAARMPKAGGVYTYMKEAFHPSVAFMFGWATLLVGQTGGIAAIAVAFARYFKTLVPVAAPDAVVAVAVIALVAVINCIGVRTGNVTQRTVMLLKIAAIASIVACGLVAFVRGQHGGSPAEAGALPPVGGWSVVGAFTPVMFAYNGWTSASFVSAELKNPARDLSRAMIYGMLGVVALYLAVNAICVLVLGAQGLAATKTPAAEVMNRVTGSGGATILSVFVTVSTFGLLTQLLFTIPRLYQVMAADGLFFRSVAYISPRRHVPTVSIVLQAAAAAALAAAGTYEAIMSYQVAGDFFFYGLAALALLVFVRRGVGAPGYRVPGGNLVTTFFFLACVGVTVATVVHDPEHALTGLVALLIGLPAYFAWQRAVARPTEPGTAAPSRARREPT